MLDFVPPRLNMFTNRLRANSFGDAASDYDAYRPRYPGLMIDDLMAHGVRRVLDVGAGTGIASRQLAERGAEVLAVEPDARMAAIAQQKGIPVEIDTFERWDPAGRTFDLVVFASSFQWVDPAIALPKVRELLADDGKLALLWNRLKPTKPSREDLDAIYSDYMDADNRSMEGEADEILAVISAAGYQVTQRHYPNSVHYSARQWLDMAFTHSNHLTLPAEKAVELRVRLADRIGSDGVTVAGEALAILAAPTRRCPTG